MIMGIDPGAKTGICVLEGTKIAFIKQYYKKDVMGVCLGIANTYNVKAVAIEMPKIGVLYQRKDVFTYAGQIKLAQNPLYLDNY